MINVIWAISNWKNEYDYMQAVYSQGFQFSWTFILAPTFLIADIAITGGATTLFGLTGFYAGAIAIFMSNVLSAVFFTPKGSAKLTLDAYRNIKGMKRKFFVLWV